MTKLEKQRYMQKYRKKHKNRIHKTRLIYYGKNKEVEKIYNNRCIFWIYLSRLKERNKQC